MKHARSVLLVVAAMVVAGTALAALGQAPAQKLQRAIDLVESKGDVSGAATLLEDLAKSADRQVAVRALLYLGQVYERRGRLEAVPIYRRIAEEFADQPGAVSSATARLAALVPAGELGQMETPVCEQCGEPLGSVSADGSVYVTANLSEALTIRSLSDGTTRRVAASIGPEKGQSYFPAASRDGRRIAFAWHADDAKGAELRVVAVEAGARPTVLVREGDYQGVFPFAWSADGQSVFVLATLAADSTWQLASVSVADGTLRRIRSLGWRVPAPPGHVASLSPDGRFIAYEALPTNPPKPLTARSPAGDRHIYVVAVDGSSAEDAVAAGAAINSGPVWTPDGRFVVYLSNVSGSVDVWAVPISDGRSAGSAQLVRKGVGDVVSIGMAAGGQYYFFEARRGVLRSVIASMAPRNGMVAPSDTLVGTQPAWSPDGRSVAIRRDDAIAIRTLASGQERAFRNAGLRPLPHDWFPDGGGLLVQVNDVTATPPGLYWSRLDVQTGAFAALAPVQGNATVRPDPRVRALSRDGKTLFLAAASGGTQPAPLDRIVALDLATGDYREVLRLPFEVAHLPVSLGQLAIAASPDSDRLVLQILDPTSGTARLAIVGTDGRNYQELAAGMPARLINGKLLWSANGSIYFTQALGLGDSNYEKHRILRIASAGGTPVDTGIEIEGMSKFDVTADGLRLTYGLLRPEGAAMRLWRLDVGAILGTAR